MEQFRILTDIREYLNKHKTFCARPTPEGKHQTLYLDSSEGETQDDIRLIDYEFSACRKWVKPHRQKGLSFSAHWQHLKSQHKLKKKHAKGAKVDVFWVIEKCNLPPGLEFIADEKDNQHYFLAYTGKEPVTSTNLRAKLLFVADHMSVIREAQGAL